MRVYFHINLNRLYSLFPGNELRPFSGPSRFVSDEELRNFNVWRAV